MWICNVQSISVQVSHSVVSLPLHGLQLTRLPCPSPTPGACSNSCPSSQWCHPTISSSVVPSALNLSQHQGPFQWVSSSHQLAKVLEFQLQHRSVPLPFLMSQLLASGGQSTEVSASAPVLPMHIQDWFPLGLTCFISLQSKGLTLKSLFQHHSQKHQFYSTQLSSLSKSHHPYMTTGKTSSFD